VGFISFQGKGTENVSHYPRAKLTYLDIPTIHAVRDSYDSLRSLCLSTESSKWYSSLEGTQWLAFISLIIKVGRCWGWGFRVGIIDMYVVCLVLLVLVCFLQYYLYYNTHILFKICK